jgi:hypothetical protein
MSRKKRCDNCNRKSPYAALYCQWCGTSFHGIDEPDTAHNEVIIDVQTTVLRSKAIYALSKFRRTGDKRHVIAFQHCADLGDLGYSW